MHRHLGRLAARTCSSVVHQQQMFPPSYAVATTSSMQNALQAPQSRHAHAASHAMPRVQEPTQQASFTSAQRPTRTFASDTGVSSEQLFHKVADETLDALVQDLEVVIDERGLDAADLEYGQGVLTLKLGEQGTYVINKQGPNQQIWLSSPVSGPVRYDLSSGDWVYGRDGHLMHDRLETEFGELMDGPVSLSRLSSGSKP